MAVINDKLHDELFNAGKEVLDAVIKAKTAEEFRRVVVDHAAALHVDESVRAHLELHPTEDDVIQENQTSSASASTSVSPYNTINGLKKLAAIARVRLGFRELDDDKLAEFILMPKDDKKRYIGEQQQFGIKDYAGKDELVDPVSDDDEFDEFDQYATNRYHERVNRRIQSVTAFIIANPIGTIDVTTLNNSTTARQFLSAIESCESDLMFLKKMEDTKYDAFRLGAKKTEIERARTNGELHIQNLKGKIVEKQDELIILMKANQEKLNLEIQNASRVTDVGLLGILKTNIEKLINANKKIAEVLDKVGSPKITEAKEINNTADAYTKFMDATIAVNNYLTADPAVLGSPSVSIKSLNDQVAATSDLVDTAPDFKTVIQPQIKDCCTKLVALQDRYRDIETYLKDAAIKQVTATREAAEQLLAQMKQETIKLENAIYELRGKAALIYRANFIADKKDFLEKKPVSIQGPETAKAVSYDPRLMMQTKSEMDFFDRGVVNKEKNAAEGATRTNLADLGAKGGAGAFVAGDPIVRYKGVVLAENQAIRAVAKLDPDKKGNERVLVIEKYRNGITLDKIDDATYKTLNPAQKLQVALEQAKMLLADYPTHGSRPPIVITSGDEKRVKLFHAVLLVLLQDTANEIKIENRVLNKKGKNTVPEMAGKEHGEENKKFINSQLSEKERESIAPDRNEFRHLINVERNKTSEYRAILSEVQETKNPEAEEYLKNKLNASDEEEISFNRSARPTL